MIRFVKPDGSPVDLDYMGNIHAIDNGNDIIAICCGGTPFDKETLENGTVGNPLNWDDWSIVINHPQPHLLQKSIATIWSALSTFSSVFELCKEE